MAVIPSPLSNSIQGINQSTISGSVFGGNKSDSETKSTLQSLSSSVTSLQSQVNELGKSNIANFKIFANLQDSLVTQIGGVNLQLNKVNETLESIATITANESAIDKQKNLYEQEKEKRLAEAGTRGGQESLLETRIQSALSEPVKRIGNKISFGFNNLISFIWTLLGGWLTLEIIKGIKAFQDNDKKKLNEIKDTVIKTLLVAGGVFTIINVGIVKIIGSIVGLAGKIGKFVIKNTIGKLFEGVIGLAKGVKDAITKVGTKEAEAVTKGATEGATKGAGEGLLNGVGKSLGGVGKFLGPMVNLAFGGIDFMGRKKEGQTNTQAVTGATSSVLASEAGIKIGSKFPGWTKLLAMPVLGAGGYVLGGKGSDMLTGVDKSKSPKPADAKPAPTTSMIPPASNLQLNSSDTSKPDTQKTQDTQKEPDTSKPATSAPSPEMVSKFEQAWKMRNFGPARGQIEDAWGKMTPEQKQQAKDWAESTGKKWSEMKLPDTNQTSAVPPKEMPKSAETSSKPPTSPTTTPAETSSKPSTAEITPAQTTKMQTVPFNIGPEPEPKPNIVYAPSGSSTPPQQQPLSTGPASDVPFIPSSNPDNFYTLYSQINYNVVM